MTLGLGWGGVVLLTGLAGLVSGCSSVGPADSTAAIASPAATDASGAPAGGTTVADGTQMQGVGKAITLADASCDQIKAELSTFSADKIPDKLADFGKAKYRPTSEESIRFARYVDVEKASKDKNCAPAKMVKKPVVAKADPAAAAKKKPVADAKAAAKPAVKPAAMAAAPAKPAQPAPAAKIKPVLDAEEDGLTVTVPDTSG